MTFSSPVAITEFSKFGDLLSAISQVVQLVKHSPANARDTGSTPGSGRSSGEGNGNPLRYSCLGKSHGQKSLVSCGPWGGKESGMTERLTLAYLLTNKIVEVIQFQLSYLR